MDTYRALLAVVISFVILVGYQYFFVGFDSKKAVKEPAAQTSVSSVATTPAVNQTGTPPKQETLKQSSSPSVPSDHIIREINVDTDLYSAVITENGGAIKSFILKDYKASLAKNSPGVQLVKSTEQEGFPLTFSWGDATANTFYSAAADKVQFTGSETSMYLLFSEISLSSRGSVIALLHTPVGTTCAYCQLLIQPMEIRLPSDSGIFENVTVA